MTYYKIMEEQAVARLIISHKPKDRCIKISSHYANIDEFLSFYPIESIEWYEIKGKNKVILSQCETCGNIHFDGTRNNCI